MAVFLAKEEVWNRLKSIAMPVQRRGQGAVPPALFKRIGEGSVTIQELQSFLKSAPHLPLQEKQPLLLLEASLLYQEEQYEEGIKSCDAALRYGGYPLARLLKAVILLQLHRFNEASRSFQLAYEHPNNLGVEKRSEFLRVLFWVWSMAALVKGLDGILNQNASELEGGVKEYLNVLDKAKGNQSEDSCATLPFPKDVMVHFAKKLPEALARNYVAKGQVLPDELVEQASQLLQDALTELELAVRLLSIKDPFDRWRALSQEISKVWPKGVSAADAIREQRDRKWNT